MEAKRAEIQAYRQSRSEMSDRRERDRKLRNSMKVLQLKLYQQMQVRAHSAVMQLVLLTVSL